MKFDFSAFFKRFRNFSWTSTSSWNTVLNEIYIIEPYSAVVVLCIANNILVEFIIFFLNYFNFREYRPYIIQTQSLFHRLHEFIFQCFQHLHIFTFRINEFTYDIITLCQSGRLYKWIAYKLVSVSLCNNGIKLPAVDWMFLHRIIFGRLPLVSSILHRQQCSNIHFPFWWI